MVQREAWIETVGERDAKGLLAELYAANKDPAHGVVDNILKVHSLNPESLRDHAQMYRNVMHGPSGLSRAERELMAVVVSSINECRY